MGEELTPRKGVKSAPSDRPASDAKINKSGRSAPTERPAVESKTPRTGGDGSTPTSVKSNVKPPVGPRKTGKDSHITRSA